jgi:uncharacterized protein (TIGR02145 family)
VLNEGNDAGDTTIVNLRDPVNAQDAATKAYVEARIADLEFELEYRLVKDSIVDIDGNYYQIVMIGSQYWMAENLRTTAYNGGVSIPKVADSALWSNLTMPAYCWHTNDSAANAELYGALYNYHTIADTNSLNVCPAGWDVPADAEWTVLTDFLEVNGYGYEGSGSDIGKSMATTFGWINSGTPDTIGNDQGTNNSSGFAGSPGGARDDDGPPYTIGGTGGWWSSTEDNTASAWIRYLWFVSDNVTRYSSDKKFGWSFLCLRD